MNPKLVTISYQTYGTMPAKLVAGSFFMRRNQEQITVTPSGPFLEGAIRIRLQVQLQAFFLERTQWNQMTVSACSRSPNIFRSLTNTTNCFARMC